MATADLTAETLRALVSYDPLSGVMRREYSVQKTLSGAELQGKCNGYIVGKILGTKYYVHRLAWLYMTGEHPLGEIDHINGCRSDNRWDNLRSVSRKTNSENEIRARSNNKIGLAGVYSAKGKFRAAISSGGKTTHLGYFETAEDAHKAYAKEKRKMHAGCTI